MGGNGSSVAFDMSNPFLNPGKIRAISSNTIAAVYQIGKFIILLRNADGSSDADHGFGDILRMFPHSAVGV